jgi:hypothetical protein
MIRIYLMKSLNMIRKKTKRIVVGDFINICHLEKKKTSFVSSELKLSKIVSVSLGGIYK